MKYCGVCGKQLPDNMNFCTSCGSAQDTQTKQNYNSNYSKSTSQAAINFIDTSKVLLMIAAYICLGLQIWATFCSAFLKRFELGNVWGTASKVKSSCIFWLVVLLILIVVAIIMVAEGYYTTAFILSIVSLVIISNIMSSIENALDDEFEEYYYYGKTVKDMRGAGFKMWGVTRILAPIFTGIICLLDHIVPTAFPDYNKMKIDNAYNMQNYSSNHMLFNNGNNSSNDSSNNIWVCPDCGCQNASYIGTCRCGKTR